VYREVRQASLISAQVAGDKAGPIHSKLMTKWEWTGQVLPPPPAAEVARGVEAVVQQIGVAAAEGSGANADHAHPEGSEDDAEEHVGASAVLLELWCWRW